VVLGGKSKCGREKIANVWEGGVEILGRPEGQSLFREQGKKRGEKQGGGSWPAQQLRQISKDPGLQGKAPQRKRMRGGRFNRE